jgi:uncharacterized repeat protein (TIGR01451 family)
VIHFFSVSSLLTFLRASKRIRNASLRGTQIFSSMKHTLLILLVIVTSLTLHGQTVIYNENFTPPTSGTSGGAHPWFPDSTYYTSSGYSIRDTVPGGPPGTSTWYMTNSIDFSTFGYAAFQFKHICKIPAAQNATIEVSVNGTGGPWTVLNGGNYKTNFYNSGQGSSFFPGNGYFSSIAYPGVWSPANPTQLPDPSWWRNEIFDISSIAAFQPNVCIRFKLTNVIGNITTTGDYGWLIDDLKVLGGISNPPAITNLTCDKGPTYTGPFVFQATIPSTGSTCCNSAYLYYSINNGPIQSVVMVNIFGSFWNATIPSANPLDTINYMLQVLNWSGEEGNLPNSFMPYSSIGIPFQTPGGTMQFILGNGTYFPYYENFDINADGWYIDSTLNQGSTWQWGMPNVGVTSGSYSFPNCWDVDLQNPYVNNTHTYLYTPGFSIYNSSDLYLSFWRNHNMEAGHDGMRIEYDFNQSGVWTTLGSIGDTNASNWYDTLLDASGKPGWSGSTGGSWIRSSYHIASFIGISGIWQFRFVFDADSSGNFDGVSIDDFSIAPFIDTLQFLNGYATLDNNANCVIDSGDSPIAYRKVFLTDSANISLFTYTDASGFYSFYVPAGPTYYVTLQNSASWNAPGYLPLCPVGGTFSITSVPSAGNNFYSVACQGNFDITPQVKTWGFRPGFASSICVYPKEFGCDMPSGQVRLVLDPLLTALAGIGYTISGDTVIWNISPGTGYFQSLCVTVITSASASIGDSVCVTATIFPITGDINPTNNTVMQCRTVVNTWDPNEKSAEPVGAGINHAILPGTDLTYTIQFQNTGTATANDVFILDPLDSSLDVNTLEILATSHTMTPAIQPGNILRFSFNNINLPDSFADELQSHGYVTFKIKTKAGIANSTVIQNGAVIYFDNNPGIITNTVFHTIDFTLGLHETGTLKQILSFYPNPAEGRINIRINKPGETIVALHDLAGRKVLEKKLFSSGPFELGTVAPGTYLLVITRVDGMASGLIVIR